MRKVPKLRFKDSNGSNYPEWEEKRLENISELITKGTTPKKFIENGNIKFIKVEAINSDKINNKKCLFISEETHTTELQRSILKKNDLLFSIAGSLGKTALIEQENLPANTNQALCIIRLNKNQNHKFVLYSLNSKTMINYILLNTSVGAQPNLSLEQMKNFKFFIPNLQEQEKIANFLSSIDKKISLTEEKLELFREYKKGVMQKIFSQELRFKDNEGNDYPEWEEKRLGDLILLQRGSSPRPIVKYLTTSNDGVNWIKIGDTNKENKYITSTSEKITKEGAKKSREVKKEEIILSNSMSYGRPFILKIDGYIHDGWFVIRKYEKYFNKEFLCQLLGSDFIQLQYKKVAAGGVVENISSELVNSVKVKVLSLEEQQKIADFLSSIDSKIENIEKELEELKEFKRGLLQQMFV